MDPVLALAIFTLGAFFIVLLTTVIYVISVRSDLVDPADLGALDERLHAELTVQRTMVEQLNTALAQHTQQLRTAAESDPLRGENLETLQNVLQSQTQTVETLNGLLHEQSAQLAGLDDRLIRQENVLTQLTGQNETLGRLADHLERSAAESPPDVEHITGLIQAQADRLADIGAKLDDWAVARAPGDDEQADHARILAELDREIAAQTQTIQRIDARAAEHTTMLLSAATERREQSGLVERILVQLGQVFPLLKQIAASPPRPGQDRLTDIKGIGPVYAGKLYEAGIQTFKQLAAMTPEELYTLISEPKWRMRSIDAESWINQAQNLASQREKVEHIL